MSGRSLSPARRRCAADRLVFGVLFAVVAANVASRVVSEGLCCLDDANAAVPARNLAAGLGYASSYPSEPRRPHDVIAFEPAITTGPTLGLPVAGAIALLGARYWIPGAVTALVIGVLVLGSAPLLRPLVDRDWGAWRILAVWLALAQLISIGRMEQWSAMLGEVPAALLVIASTALVARDRASLRSAAGAGVLFGLALGCKTIALFGLVAPLAAIVATGRTPAGRGRTRRTLGVFAVGALGPPAAWAAFQLATLGVDGFLDVQRRFLRFVAMHPGSGVTSLHAGDGGVSMEIVRAHLAALDAELRVPLGGAALAIAWIGLVAATAPGKRGTHRLAFSLALAAAGDAAWWLVVAPEGRIRYLLVALLLFAMAVAAIAADIPRSRSAVSVVALAGFALLGRVAALPSWAPPRPWFERSARVEAMLATAAFLDRIPEPRTFVADWMGSAIDLEYLLRRPASFTHDVFFEPASAPNAWVVRDERALGPRSDAGASARLDAAIERCGGRLAFSRPPYAVHRCERGVP